MCGMKNLGFGTRILSRCVCTTTSCCMMALQMTTHGSTFAHRAQVILFCIMEHPAGSKARCTLDNRAPTLPGQLLSSGQMRPVALCFRFDGCAHLMLCMTCFSVDVRMR